MDAVLELQKKKKLPNAFKPRKPRKISTKKLPEEKDIFTFLDKVFTSEINSSSLFIPNLQKQKLFLQIFKIPHHHH